MENKMQLKNESKDTSLESEPQKKENTNSIEESPPAKRECHSITKSPPSETKILPLPPPRLETNIFFELFYYGPYDLRLSNRSWGTHRVPPPNRAIILSEITLDHFNVSTSPSYKKQIIFTDNLKFVAFVLDKLVVEKTLDRENTEEDFEQSFAEILNMVVCKGGLKIEDNQEVLLRCAYRDFYSNRWRHKSCTIIISTGFEACMPCSYLYKYFQEWVIQTWYNSKDK